MSVSYWCRVEGETSCEDEMIGFNNAKDAASHYGETACYESNSRGPRKVVVRDEAGNEWTYQVQCHVRHDHHALFLSHKPPVTR